ncbi:MAG: SMC-Scp complex subunit ScpB [Bacteriovoracia bacterium]
MEKQTDQFMEEEKLEQENEAQQDQTEETIETEATQEDQSTVVDETDLLALANKEGLSDLTPDDGQPDLQEDHASFSLSKHEEEELMAGMEVILFMSDKPVSLPKMRSTLNAQIPIGVYRRLMAQLREHFALNSRGVEIAEVSLGFQLRTKPHLSGVLRKMVRTEPLRLTGTNMEVLAIVAYKQPVIKDDIDKIRGVDSGYVLRNLMEKRLVRISGRSDLPGRPMLYSTTHEFLELFSLRDVKSLPPLHEIEAMVAQSEAGTEEKAEEVLRGFSKMIENQSQVLFDDSQIDEELESIRSEIASISTSTPFIEDQKRKEKLTAELQADPEGQALLASGLSPEDAHSALKMRRLMVEEGSKMVDAHLINPTLNETSEQEEPVEAQQTDSTEEQLEVKAEEDQIPEAWDAVSEQLNASVDPDSTV